jgi:FAD/FMN-containing dehydrogenase/Fe-S oxidoreductase
MEQVRVEKFRRALAAQVKGDVLADKLSTGLYSTDASIYQITPVAVVLPRDETDVRRAAAVAAEHGVNIVPRGAGTSLNGQAIGPGMVVDFSRYMNHILELDIQGASVSVQPGVVLDELNAALAKYGLFFAPDPATGNRATIGGMVGNNSSGSRSIVYGMTSDHVLETKVLLADGVTLDLNELSAEQYNRVTGSGRQAQIFSDFRQIIEQNTEEIRRRFPNVPRRVQGYNLRHFTETDRWNLSRLITGSEGTLGLVLRARLKLLPIPPHKSLCTVHFAELLEALRAVAPILQHGPSAVEIIDGQMLSQARQRPDTAPLCNFVCGKPGAVLIIEFFGDSQQQTEQKARALAAELESKKLGYAWPVITGQVQQTAVWQLRKKGLALMVDAAGKRKPAAFIEDACVPIEILPEYIERILNFCRGRGVPVSMYAHASVGTIHVRPCLNLKEQTDIENLKSIAEFAFELVCQYGGALSGEHGDGRSRSPFLERYFGSQLYDAFRQVKRLFDPAGLMNPGIIIDPNPIEQDLRYGPRYKCLDVSTKYHYREIGSFAAAVELCTGTGDCRQRLQGAMCPSYRATRQEHHSTRGRANALRLAITGRLSPDAITSRELFELLDLCLSCKACKAECPNNIDMAQLKSEVLQKYHDAHGLRLRERIVANSPLIAAIVAGWKAPAINRVQKTRLFRKLLELAAGFDSRRALPEYTRLPLPTWFARRARPNGQLDKKVALFNDTYMSYHQTDVGIAAVELLESCGYEVILANAGCCQRPRISHGFLRQAKIRGEKTLRNLDKYIKQGLKIIVCEPGCCSALTDDLPDLIDDETLARRIKENVMMVDKFLAQEISEGRLKCRFTTPFKNILIHGHCHQKALFGTAAMKDILQGIPGVLVSDIDCGCCGMAGSFGYEKEHYDLSIQIGEDRLFAAIRNRPEGSAVIASGFSCRHQIADGTGTTALHFVQTLRAATLT